MPITNPRLTDYQFLESISNDSYYPGFLIDQGKQILIQLCEAIEQHKPESIEEVYQLTHATTEAFNELAEAFYDNGSEIETVARDAIAVDVEAIVKAYGFEDVDLEEALDPREW